MPTITTDVGQANLEYSGSVVTMSTDPLSGGEAFLRFFVEGGFVGLPVTVPDPTLDVVLTRGTVDKGTTTLRVSVEGDLAGFTLVDGSVTVGLSVEGFFVPGFVALGTFESTFELVGEFSFREAPVNWLAWTKVGSAEMTFDQANEAGLAPMEWPGWMLRALQLGDSVIVYGFSGVSVARPVSSPVPTWGFSTLLRETGLASAYSVAGSERRHFFVSGQSDLWMVTAEGPQRLGFREFLEELSSPVLNYDETYDRLFISDNVRGFIYDQGLGGGYAALSSVSRGLMMSPGELSGVPLAVMTDTLDFGHRGLKQLTWVELGTDTFETLEVACDFRYRVNESWRTSPWVRVNNEGAGFLGVTGVEFRVRVRQLVFEPIRLDYVNVRFRNLDKRFLRGPLGGGQ